MLFKNVTLPSSTFFRITEVLNRSNVSDPQVLYGIAEKEQERLAPLGYKELELVDQLIDELSKETTHERE